MASFLWRLTRRKTHGLEEELNEHGSPKLARVLGPLDLIFLGVGSTLGVGVYVLAGEVAKNNAGPAVCLSFLVAAVASAFAALCYAEFGARVPKAGSAYVYSYVTVGELMAFVIGWNLILEYLIGSASVAKSFSENFDKLLNRSMSEAFIEVFPINASGLGPYVDWFSFSVTLLLTCLLAFGMKGSSLFTNVFTCVNLINVLLVIIAGLFFVDVNNWSITPNSTGLNETVVGQGGFAPWGFAGIMDGAATCFFAFVGFDSIAATSEEAKNPKRDIPLAIMTTLIVVFFAYFGVSTVLTLMIPYYLQTRPVTEERMREIFEELLAKSRVQLFAEIKLLLAPSSPVSTVPEEIMVVSERYSPTLTITRGELNPISRTNHGVFVGSLLDKIFKEELVTMTLKISTKPSNLVGKKLVPADAVQDIFEFIQKVDPQINMDLKAFRKALSTKLSNRGRTRKDPNTPLVSAFYNLGQEELAITVSVGSLFGISASLLGAMIPLPRIVYAMSRDGLVFRLLGRINRKTQTPILATAVLGLFAAVLSMIFDLAALIDMMSIGTLLAYTLVAVSVLIIRYTHYDEEDEPLDDKSEHTDVTSRKGFLSTDWLGRTTQRSQMISYILIGAYCLLCIGVAAILVIGEEAISTGSDVGLTVGVGILGALILLSLVALTFQPRSQRTVYFMVPLIPLIPCLSVFVNIYLMMRLSTATWIRFAIWMALGFAIYFCYGVWFSSEEYVAKGKAVPGEGPLLPVTDKSKGEVNATFDDDEKIEMKSAGEATQEKGLFAANIVTASALVNEAFENSDDEGKIGEDEKQGDLRKFATLEALHQADSLLTPESDSESDDETTNQSLEDLVEKQQGILNGSETPDKNPEFVPVPVELEKKTPAGYTARVLTPEEQEGVDRIVVAGRVIHLKAVQVLSPVSEEAPADPVGTLHSKIQGVLDGSIALVQAEPFVAIPCPPRHPREVGQPELPQPDPEFIATMLPLIVKTHLSAQACFLHSRVPKDQPNLLPMMHELKSKVAEKPSNEYQYEKPPGSPSLDVTKKDGTIPAPDNAEVISALKNAFSSRQEIIEGIDSQSAVAPSMVNGKAQ